MLNSLGVGAPATHRQTPIKTAAREFEAVFLARMLQAAGAGQAAKAYGGGVGESQFASFLLDAQAQRIANSGGIGLAEMIIRSYAPPRDPGAP